MPATQAPSRFIDPLLLAKLGNMALRARLVVEGFISGQHKSPLRGASLEFAQHREYSPGDELKSLDWKVYGRTDRYFVKQYEEETSLRATLILDSSRSMGFATAGISKFQYGSTLTAALAYLLISQQDSAGLVLFDEKIRQRIPERSGREHLRALFGALEETQPSGVTQVSRALMEVGPLLKRRGLVILISDLLDEPEHTLEALRFFRYRKHEVLVFHILDPFEQDLPAQGSFLFEDLETGEKLSCDVEVIRAEYRVLTANFQDRFLQECLKMQIDLFPMDTRTPLDLALGAVLSKRTKVRARA